MRRLLLASFPIAAIACSVAPGANHATPGVAASATASASAPSILDAGTTTDDDDDGATGYRPRTILEQDRMHVAWGEALPRGAKARLGSKRLYRDFSVVVAAADGSFVSASPYYAGLQRWNADTGALLATAPPVGELSFNVATTSADRKIGAFADWSSVALVDLTTLKLIKRFEVFDDSNGRIKGLAFLDDGKLLVGGCSKNPARALRVFDSSGSEQRSISVPAPKESYEEACAGPLVARAGWIGAVVNGKGRLIPQKGSAMKGEIESGVAAEAVALSADGSRFFVGGYGSAVNAFDTKTLKPVRSYGYFAYDSDREVRGLALSPDESTLAVSASTVRLYDVATGLERARLDGGTGRATDFASQGELLAFPLAHPAMLGRFDWKTGAQRGPHDLGRHDDSIDFVHVASNGTLVSSSRDGSIRAWRPDGTPVATVSTFVAPGPSTLAGGTTLLALLGTEWVGGTIGKPSCSVTLFDAATLARREVVELVPNEEPDACFASAVATSPAGDVAYALFSKRLVAFEPATKKVLASETIDGRNGALVALSDGTIALRQAGRWELRKAATLAKLRALDLPEATFVAAAEAMVGVQRVSDEELALIDLKTGTTSQSVRAPKGTRFSYGNVAITRDGRTAYAGTTNDTSSGLVAIAIKSGKIVGSLEALHDLGHPTSSSLSLSADGKTLVEGNTDGTALVIDTGAFGGAK